MRLAKVRVVGKRRDCPAKPAPSSNKENWIWKILPALITISGILIGVFQFNSRQKFESMMEFKRRMWDKRAATYEKLGTSAARVVNNCDSLQSFRIAVDSFEELYWGNLVLIDDSIVERNLVLFNNEIRYFTRNESTKDRLRIKGYGLMKACQKSLIATWKGLGNE